VLELYERVPDAVVCFDELGPVRPIPTAGWGWAPEAMPHRLPANYRKPHGVRFFFGAWVKSSTEPPAGTVAPGRGDPGAVPGALRLRGRRG
jgi:hypothetical protein